MGGLLAGVGACKGPGTQRSCEALIALTTETCLAETQAALAAQQAEPSAMASGFGNASVSATPGQGAPAASAGTSTTTTTQANVAGEGTNLSVSVSVT